MRSRNQPCHCGSDVRYKHCCGRLLRSDVARTAVPRYPSTKLPDVISSKQEFEELAWLLGCCGTYDFGPDWELEWADGQRVSEFIQIYNSMPLTSSQKSDLMSLILFSLDEAFKAGRIDSKETAAIERILIAEHELHGDDIDYWANTDQPGGWQITPFMREVKKRLESEQVE